MVRMSSSLETSSGWTVLIVTVLESSKVRSTTTPPSRTIDLQVGNDKEMFCNTEDSDGEGVFGESMDGKGTSFEQTDL